MKKLISSIVMCAVLLSAIGVPQISHATTFPVSIFGWAWSSNIGWISFNSASTYGGGFTGGGPHSVTIDSAGKLTGYAWSSNIGWIKFGGLSSFPSTGAPGLDAQVNVNATGTTTLTGWARACAGTTSGTCGLMISRTDGWDGWIELSGLNHAIVYDPATGSFSGYAWGGSVVGWIQIVNVYAAITGTPPGAPTLSATCSGVRNYTTATWTVGASGGTPSGTAPGYTYAWTVDGAATSTTAGTISAGPFASGTHGAVVTVTDGASPTPAQKFATCTALNFDASQGNSNGGNSNGGGGICVPGDPGCGGDIPSGSNMLLRVDPLTRYPVVTNTNTSGVIKTAKVRKGKPFDLRGNIDVSAFDSYSIRSDDAGTTVLNVVNQSQSVTQNTQFVTYDLYGIKDGVQTDTKIKVQAMDPTITEK